MVQRPVPGRRAATSGLSRSRVGLVLLLVLVVGGLWWRHHRAAEPPRPSAVQPGRGSGSASVTLPRGEAIEPARLRITVTDSRGPLAGAIVRLAPSDGEVLSVMTGRDGVARADHLEPGAWQVSASAAGHLPAALPTTRLAAGAETALAITLSSGGRTLRGTVSDATGGPIAGARIDAARLGAARRSAAADPQAAVASTLTAPDGSYRLSVAQGTVMVAAASPEYAPQARAVEVGEAGAVADFALVPGGVIEGVVRDERTRQPIAGARVLARRDNPSIQLAETGAHHATSGADGRFQLGGLRPGAWELAARDPARSARAPTVVGLGVAEQVRDVELLIGPGPVVRGVVIDDTGAPAPGTAVEAVTRGAGGAAVADTAGAFVLEGLRPGAYVLVARGPSYVPAAGTRIAVADQDLDRVVVNVRRGTTIQGHVEPRQVCEVEPASGDRPGGPMLTASGVSTLGDGEFAIGPAVDGPTRLTARCPSGDQGSTQVTVARGMPDVVLKVTPGASIAGHVVDGAGQPVAGVGVAANEVSRGEHTTIRNGVVTSGARAVTDASGGYVIDGLAPGTYQLRALDRGKPMPVRRAPPPVELAASAHKTGADLTVDRPDGVISGTVTGPDATPVADAWVTVQQDVMAMLDDGARGGGPASRTMLVDGRDGAGGADAALPPGLTDAQGHYEVRGLPHGVYGVTAEAQRGQLRARASNVKPDAVVDLQVLGVTTLSGTVAGAAGPGAVFSVELDGPTRAQRSFTDGSFAFGRVDPGAYTVHVEAADQGNGDATVDVKPGEPATVAITLTANATVIGTLVDPSGKPLAGLAVVLAPDHHDGKPQIQIQGPPPTTDAAGRFRIDHRAEPCVLIVMLPQPVLRPGLELVAGKTYDVGAVTVVVPAADAP